MWGSELPFIPHIYETHFIQDVKWGQGRSLLRNISTSFLTYEPCTFRLVIFPLIHNASAINIQSHISSVIVVTESGSSHERAQATITRMRRKSLRKKLRPPTWMEWRWAPDNLMLPRRKRVAWAYLHAMSIFQHGKLTQVTL